MTILNTETYPKIIQDLFLYDQSTSNGSAHWPITLPFEYDNSKLLEEAEKLPYDNRKVQRCYVWGPEGDKDPGCDLLTDHAKVFEAKIDLTQYPHIKKFIDDANKVGPVTYMTFKKMEPKGYILPHVDSECNPYKVYVPLSWPEGSCFKVFKQGKVDFSDLKPNIIATSDHMHSVVNDSDQYRIIFSFYVDWSSLGWSKLLRKI